MSGSSCMVMDSGPGVVIIPLPGGTSTAQRIGSTTVTLTFGRDGSVIATKTASASWSVGPVNHGWFSQIGGTPGDSYWVRATPTSGTFSGGTTGSWLQLNADRAWTVTATAPGTPSKVCTATFEIATDSGGTNIVASGSYTIDAEDQT